MNARGPVSFRRIREVFPDYRAENEESSRRKFERDKETLRELGIAIRVVAEDELEGLEGSAYAIDTEETFIPEVEFEEDEVLALVILSRVARHIDHFPLKRQTEEALRKILYDRQDDTGAEDRAGVPVHLPDLAANPRQHDWIARIYEAMERRKTLHTRYHTFWSDQVKDRAIDPYGLVYQAGRWSLSGWCHLRKEERIFLVERFEDVRLNERNPSRPDFEIPAGYDVRKAIQAPPWLWEGDRSLEVEIEFSPRVAWQVEKSHARWGRFETLPDGAGRLRIAATQPDALIQWCLGFGSDARVVGPPEVVQQIVAKLRRALANHEGEPAAPPAASPRPGRATKRSARGGKPASGRGSAGRRKR